MCLGQEIVLTDPMDQIIGEDSDIPHLHAQSLVILSELEDLIYRAFMRAIQKSFSSE